MQHSIIEARGLIKSYPRGARALDSVDLRVTEGSRFVLLGPNGAGKSTLVRVLSTLSRPDRGTRTLCGHHPEKDLPQVMRLIGVVGQENDLDPEGRVEEMLCFQGALFAMGRAERMDRARELIGEFGLAEHRGKRVRELSGGNKRKLHCALAMVHRPKLLFLDEPTVGMDPEVRSRFWEAIRRSNREEGMTLFLTTQYLEEADRHAEEMALLIEGRVRFRGSVQRFKELTRAGGSGTAVASSLEDVYLRYLERSPDAYVEKVERYAAQGETIWC